MNVHKNARLTPHGRERIALQIASGQTPKAVSEAAGVCHVNLARLQEEFPIGLIAWTVDASGSLEETLAKARCAIETHIRERLPLPPRSAASIRSDL